MDGFGILEEMIWEATAKKLSQPNACKREKAQNNHE
jgi:hypothetical protein